MNMLIGPKGIFLYKNTSDSFFHDYCIVTVHLKFYLKWNHLDVVSY